MKRRGMEQKSIIILKRKRKKVIDDFEFNRSVHVTMESIVKKSHVVQFFVFGRMNSFFLFFDATINL